MTILYIDYENGNDNNGGTSFNVLHSGANGRITDSTFSAATANFPNDGSLINHYLSIFNGSQYLTYVITAWISSTSLTIAQISGGTALQNQTVNRQYYIGGRWKNITTGATAVRTVPGDEIRIMASPEPTAVGSGTWTSLLGRAGAATSNVVSATNASPIRVTCASTMSDLGIRNGDTVLINLNTSNTNSNGVWEVSGVSGSSCDLVGSSGNFNQTTSNGILRNITHRVVTLDNPVTVNIASFGNRGTAANPRTAWIASTNVTASLDTTNFDTKEGDVSDFIQIAAAFTTGKAAYKTTVSTLDLSGYQQISFYIKQTAGSIIQTNDLSLQLCSDSVGDVPVNTFNLPGTVLLNRWVPFTINLDTNLGSSINSIALRVNVDRGAQNILLSNIIACKSTSSNDSLNLQSLIGKNSVDTECWFPIMSINNTRIVLGITESVNNNPTSTANRGGYYGTNEKVITYKRETIKTPMTNTATTILQEVVEAGIGGSPMNYIFGWNRTDMSTRVSETFFDGLNGLGWGFYYNGRDYTNVSYLGCVRYDRGIRIIGSRFNNHGPLYSVGNSTIGIDLGSNLVLNNFELLNSAACSEGVLLDFGFYNNTIQKVVSMGHLSNSIRTLRGFNNNKINYITSATSIYGIFSEVSSNNIYNSGNFMANGTDGVRFYLCNNDQFLNCTTSGNLTNGFYSFSGETILNNCIINESVEFGHYPYGNSKICCINHDNTSGNYLISTDNGIIRAQTNVRYTNAGYCWSFSPTSATARISQYPLDLKIATIAVNANALVIVKAWMRRNNSLLNLGLRIKGGQIAGVPSDITSYMDAASDTWQQVTLSFTPTEIGVVEILAECWGGSIYTGYIDDLTIIQA